MSYWVSHMHMTAEKTWLGFCVFVLSEYAGKLEPLSSDEEMVLTKAARSKISKRIPRIPTWFTSVPSVPLTQGLAQVW